MAKCVLLLLLLFSILDSLANDDVTRMTLEDWAALSTSERREIASKWSPYEPQTADSVPTLIAEEFRRQHPNLDFRGLGNVHGSLELVVIRPFIFDKRLIPDSFLGLVVKSSLSESVPDGFDVYSGYVWAPENYANFVDKNMETIREALGNDSISREEMLHALIGMPFEDWVDKCREFGDQYTDL